MASDVIPVKRASGGFIAALALGVVGSNVATYTPILVALPLRVQQIDPTGKTVGLSLVLGLGTLFAVIANPIFGKLSDRTTSRFGMRRPWILLGAVGGTIGLLVTANATSIPMVIAAWCFTQAAYNALYAAEIALIADQVPEEQQGWVSSILGVAFPLALLVATFIAQALASSTELMIVVGALVGLIPAIILCLVLKDRRLAGPARKYRVRDLLGSLWVNPVKHPDFGWAWLSRLLVWMGPTSFTTYMAYYLSDRLGVAEGDVPRLVFVATLVNTVALLVTSPISGRLSDKLGRRKPFALIAVIVIVAGLVAVSLAGGYPLFLVGAAVIGLGQGIYTSVDYAVPAAVIPNPDDAAKDLGVMNIALTLPGSLLPAIAPLFLGLGGYPALFVAGAVFSVLGVVALRQVRAVR